MGRMLDALKRTDEIKPIMEPVVGALPPEPVNEGPPDEDFPFVEVGGPRKAAETTTRLELPSPRAATLQVRPPQGVTLQPAPQASSARPRIAAELVAFHQPNHAVTQQYAALFEQLPLDPVDDMAPAFLFTSLSPGAGTTTALLNLAIAGCQKHGKSVVVVDANLVRPAAAARLGACGSVGLADVLQGKIGIKQALQQTAVKNLCVLPAGTLDGGDSQADAIRWIITWLRQRFDLVLIDAAARDDDAKLPTLPASASAVYLVADATEIQQPAVRALTREVARQGSRLGGLIVTQ